MKYFYEKNDELINSDVNCNFEDILWMDETAFDNWVLRLRTLVVELWDTKGLPPRVGFNEADIIDQFRKMISFPVEDFLITNLDTNERDIIRNTSILGNAVNQWFPTQMKTRITTGSSKNAKSIYDWFKDPDLFDRFRKYAYRNLKRDSFYHYSSPIAYDQIREYGNKTFRAKSISEFVEWFESNNIRATGWDYFLSPVQGKYEYTGYNTELKDRKNFVISGADPDILKIPEKCRTIVDTNLPKTVYQIRVFKYGQKLFPLGLKAFKVTFSQYAVNFPPLTANYLYKKYTNHIKNQEVIRLYDPSAGWGGRLLGALALATNQKYLYIGTDPNTDHNTTPGRTKYHEITDFFNENVSETNTLFADKQESEIYQLGSEVISTNVDFQKHKGLVDMVFTSPPYFSKEVYSDDENQSCHKFGDSYESWKKGFLQPTLETAVEWLRNDRYLLWNIADVDIGGKFLPLEEDSAKILVSLGMEYVGTMKMALAAMPGANRFEVVGEYDEIVSDIYGDETVKKPRLKGKMKNFCRIRGVTGKETMLKFEPIFIWRKP